MSEQKVIEIVKEGIDCKEMKFSHTCKVCDCEYKFCLNAVMVTRYGKEATEMRICCPRCNEYCGVDVGKYKPLLKKREKYIPESDY